MRHGYRDRAVFYMILSRVTTIGLGPIVLIAVGGFLSAEQQGVYYVFGSLLQLRGIIDLGFGQSSLQLLANRFSTLTLSRDRGVGGDNNIRLDFLDLSKFTLRMYVLIGLATFVLIGVFGYVFLFKRLEAYPHVDWMSAWWVTIASVAFGIATWGIVSVADAANQIALTNRWRFWIELLALVAFLATLAVGGGLWAMAVMSVFRAGLAAPIAFGLGRPLLSQIYAANSKAINFRKTILPLQSRTMVVWGMNFFCSSAYNLLTLQFMGPTVAGVVGMSMQLSNMTWAMALVWYNSKLSRLGNLAGSEDHTELVNLHKTGLKITSALWIFLAIGALTTSGFIHYFLPAMAGRIASIGSMSLFICGGGAYIWAHMRASYMRAFCVELFAPLAVVQAIVTIVCLWASLRPWGVAGAAMTYLFVMLIGAIWTELVYRAFTKRENFRKNQQLLST